MKNKNLALLILLATAVVASGCVNNSNPANSTDGTNPQSSDATNTYTSGDENSTLKVVTDEESETYELSWETKENYSEAEESPFLDKTGMVNLTAAIQCGLIQQLAYNYTGLQQGMEELNEELGSANNTESEESEIPREVLENYEATSVEGTVYNADGSEMLATCKPTRDDLNLNLQVE